MLAVLLASARVAVQEQSPLWTVLAFIVGTVLLVVVLGPALTLGQSLMLDRLRDQSPNSIAIPVQSSPRFGVTAAEVAGGDWFRSPILGVAVIGDYGLDIWASGIRRGRIAHVSWSEISKVEVTGRLYLLWSSARCLQFHVRVKDVIVPLAIAPLAEDWKLPLSVPADPQPLLDAILAQHQPQGSEEGATRASSFPGDDAEFLSGRP